MCNVTGIFQKCMECENKKTRYSGVYKEFMPSIRIWLGNDDITNFKIQISYNYIIYLVQFVRSNGIMSRWGLTWWVWVLLVAIGVSRWKR